MISYYELLGMIKEGNEPQEIKLHLNCGTSTYVACYDFGDFSHYELPEGTLATEDFKSYLADTLLESQMVEENIEIVDETNNEKIDKLVEVLSSILEKNIKDCQEKIREVIDELYSIKGALD